MDGNKLMPCPFCGGAAKMLVKKGFTGKIVLYASVACESCKASTAPFDTEETAAEAWNSRAQERKENKEI